MNVESSDPRKGSVHSYRGSDLQHCAIFLELSENRGFLQRDNNFVDFSPELYQTVGHWL